MSVQLIGHGWDSVLDAAFRGTSEPVLIACPFIKASVVKRLVGSRAFGDLRVATRFHLGDFAAGVSDIDALRLLMESGADVRGVKGLHAKVYVFGTERAIVTSANLTQKALASNAELGCESSDREFVSACAAYVEKLFDQAASSATLDQLGEWQARVTKVLADGGRPAPIADLPDLGADVRAASPAGAGGAHTSPVVITSPAPIVSSTTGWPAESEHAFVKFFGQGDDRAARNEAVLSEVASAGCHWAATYPKGKRPRQVADGDTLFMGRMTHSPIDTLIFGRAIGLAHVEGRDEATAVDIAARSWKSEWPYYVRVHHGQFVNGQLRHGVSLNEMMDALGPASFGPTQENLDAGSGNTDPRRSLMQKAHMRLTPVAFSWLTEQLENKMEHHGRLPVSELEMLDWPERPPAQ